VEPVNVEELADGCAGHEHPRALPSTMLTSMGVPAVRRLSCGGGWMRPCCECRLDLVGHRRIRDWERLWRRRAARVSSDHPPSVVVQ